MFGSRLGGRPMCERAGTGGRGGGTSRRAQQPSVLGETVKPLELVTEEALRQQARDDAE